MAIEMARLTQTAVQSVSRVTDTAVSFDSLDFDTTSGRMPSIASNRLTASTPGAYLITGSFRYNTPNDNLNKIGIGARIRNTAAQGIGNAVDTQMTFNTADNDNSISNNMTGLNANSLTCVNTGMHIVTGHIRYAPGGAGSGQWYAGLRLNGTILIQGANTWTSGAGYGELTVATMIALTAGDRISLWGYQATGFGQNTDPGFGGVTLAMVGPVDFPGTERYLSIWKNGNTTLRQAEMNNYVTTNRSALSVAAVANLAASDYIELRTYHDSITSSINSDPVFNDIHLSMALLSPA